MSRERKHVAEAQKQRVRIKEKSQKYVAGTITIQILGTGALGSPASVYLFTDQSRYLFNCGEGTQRLAQEHKVKLARLEHIFMTRTSWQHIGGLPGLSLTLQDVGVPSLTLHGPEGLGNIFGAMQRFVILKDLKVAAPPCQNGIIYSDETLSIQAISIKRRKTIKDISTNGKNNSSPRDEIVDDVDYYAHERNDKTVETFNLQSNLTECSIDSTNVMAYICKLKARQGKMCLQKCLDKGVPSGPLLGELKSGKAVTLPDGTVVYPHEVLSPSDPGPIFIVIDIPSEDYLESFIENRDLFAGHQRKAKNEDDIASVVLHFSPSNIINHAVYQEFIEQFDKNTKHLVLNDSNRFSGNLSSHRIQFQLNQLNEKVFPILGSNKRQKLDQSVHTMEEKNLTEVVLPMTYYHLRPNKGLDRFNEQTLCPEEYISESQIIPGFTESLNDLKEKLGKISENEHRKEEFPKILFLGTGSCIPNKTRNVSAILIHTTPNSSLLLDCGEGTIGQIIRFYDRDQLHEVLTNLKAIYVSHLHADHHLGFIGVLQERRRLLGPEALPIMLLAPQQISSFLRFYDKHIEPIKNEYFLVPNGNLINKPLSDEHTTGLGLNFISTCYVRHCPHSFGIAFEVNCNEPFKITYSGDTMPCHELVQLGENSSLLIHEATMEDELADQAKIKMHSTMSQAIEQGIKMNAKYTMLTHFSQRYAKLPRIENPIEMNVGIAFDNMELVSSDYKHLYLLYPTLKLLFSEHCEEMEQKALKRSRAKNS